MVELSSTLQIKERLDLPEHYQKSFKKEELKEYNERFQEYKKRKGLK